MKTVAIKTVAMKSQASTEETINSVIDLFGEEMVESFNSASAEVMGFISYWAPILIYFTKVAIIVIAIIALGYLLFFALFG